MSESTMSGLIAIPVTAYSLFLSNNTFSTSFSCETFTVKHYFHLFLAPCKKYVLVPYF